MGVDDDIVDAQPVADPDIGIPVDAIGLIQSGLICDFNTYTNLDMGPGASAGDFVDTLASELALVIDSVPYNNVSVSSKQAVGIKTVTNPIQWPKLRDRKSVV